eukprot:3404937-Prymnesium_polylepis.2
MWCMWGRVTHHTSEGRETGSGDGADCSVVGRIGDRIDVHCVDPLTLLILDLVRSQPRHCRVSPSDGQSSRQSNVIDIQSSVRDARESLGAGPRPEGTI